MLAVLYFDTKINERKKRMTYEEREEIFSKEAISIKDISCLMECSEGYASVLIRNWKRKLMSKGKELRLETEGKIHILDYFDVMNINGDDPGERYSRKHETEKSSCTERPQRRSLCAW